MMPPPQVRLESVNNECILGLEMPKRLPDRWRPECIREFRAAAKQRYDDGLALAAAGRRTGAIYMWGYCAEMLLKAAYFSVIGLADSNPITWPGHVIPAIDRGRKAFQINWPGKGQGHNVRAWAELLVLERGSLGVPFPSPFDTELHTRAQRTYQLWRETLRYHKNEAYLHEVRQVRGAVEWLLAQTDAL